MKKLLCMLLAMSMLLFSGCSGSLLTTHKSLPADAAGLQSLTINNPFSFLYQADAYNSVGGGISINTAAKAKWDDEMSNRYGIPILITSDSTDVTLNRIQDGTANNITLMDQNNIIILAKAGKILPLDDYVKDNAAWIALPDDMKAQYTFDGHIWGIPQSFPAYTNAALFVKSDWLTATGKSMPTNTTELFELGQAKQQANPSDKQNNYIFRAANMQLSNIFNSFGMYFKYLSASDYSPIGYDPQMKCFTDPFFEPEAKSALAYLHNMYTAGMINPDSFSRQSMVADYEGYDKNTGIVSGTMSFLSTLGYAYEKMTDSTFNANDKSQQNIDKVANVFQLLPPLSTKYATTYSEVCANAYVLPKNTVKPKEATNLFLDMVFLTPQHVLDSSLGSDNYTIASDRTITLVHSGNRVPYPQLISADAELLGGYQFDTSLSSVFTDQIKKTISSYISRYTTTGQLKQLTQQESSPISPEYFKQKLALITAQQKLISDAVMVGNIDQALATYQRKALGDYNLQQVLQEVNSNAGMNNAQVLNMPDISAMVG